MRFDLFDALRIMQKSLGDDVDIQVINEKHGILIRLGLFLDGERYRSQFVVSKKEIDDINVSIFNLKFRQSIVDLELSIDSK